MMDMSEEIATAQRLIKRLRTAAPYNPGAGGLMQEAALALEDAIFTAEALEDRDRELNFRANR